MAQVDATGALRKLTGMAKQARFAAGLAANETAKVVRPAVQAMMAARLDQPTRFTLESTYIRFARRGETTASIEFKDWAGKGTPAYKYLQPLVDGGMRRLKRYERALAAKGLMPGGMMAVGGKYAVDAAGNLPARAVIVPMLSALRAFGEQGYLANRAKAGTGKRVRKGQPEFFVRKTRWAGKPAGIYQRIGQGAMRRAKPIVLFTPSQRYSQILPWREEAAKVTAVTYPGKYREALARAIATART